MIELQQGDILKANVEALVNTVNCVGVMGKGIALQFKKAWPNNFKEYKITCNKKLLKPGTILIHNTGRSENPRYIVNFPTKRHWRSKSSIEDVRSGLDTLIKEVQRLGITSIAIPPLGCGLGGLSWQVIRPMIEAAFEALSDVRVLIFEPIGISLAKELAKDPSCPKLTAGRAILIALIDQYLRAAMDPFVTLLEIHKLMYFVQEAGEPLKLQYEKAHYGPYAKNLRHVLNVIEGHFITGFTDGKDNIEKQIGLKSGVAKKANEFLEAHSEPLEHFERVNKLIKGFETYFGMELLATVHWVASRYKLSSLEEVVKTTYLWNVRKKMFEVKHINLALNNLVEQQWLKEF